MFCIIRSEKVLYVSKLGVIGGIGDRSLCVKYDYTIRG